MSSVEMTARSAIEIGNIDELIDDAGKVPSLREQILRGDVFILKQAANPELLARIKEYLAQVGRNSLPNYFPIEPRCPNHHRINYNDNRSYVKACFHQFSFFPWNQDVFDLFKTFRTIFELKNMINEIDPGKFMGTEPEEGCIARLAFQFYPAGLGHMNKHADPVDHHQLVVPTLTMSRKGVDFNSGGAYVVAKDGSKLYTDDISEPGDVVLFNALMPHGVELIDREKTPDWLSFSGRWMLLFATNKLVSNTAIANAVDLGKS